MRESQGVSSGIPYFNFLQDCMILPRRADTNGSFVCEVCWLSSNESAKAE